MQMSQFNLYVSILESFFEKPKTTPVTNDRSKPRVNIHDGKISSLNVSTSLIHYLLYNGEPNEVCPMRYYHTQIIRDIKELETLPMLYGKYFESKCIGMSSDNTATLELPRHKTTGKKLSDHIRIDYAVDRFKYVCKIHEIIPQNVQKYNSFLMEEMSAVMGIDVIVEGTIDFQSKILTDSFEYPMATVDLKLTKDRDNCFPPFCWGCPEKMDMTQPMMYYILFGFPFVYLVFDYRKDNPWYKQIPIITDIDSTDETHRVIARRRMEELRQSIRWVVGTTTQWEAMRWPYEPSPTVCRNCPLFDCKERTKSIAV